MASAAMVTAAVFAAVMIAPDTGIVHQISRQQCFHRIVRVTADTAKQTDARICQSHLRTAADTAADQHVHALGLQKTCQGAMTAAGRFHDPGGDDRIIRNFVYFKSLCMAEMLKNLAIGICNSN